ncbi:hypothetical protein BH11MYX3_BH11MYX3_15880 [soil metagenome]
MARAKVVKNKPKAKATAKVKAKAKPVPRKAAAKRSERVEDAEPTGTELVLQTLACPTSTADRLSEICESAVLRVKDDLTGIEAATLVGRGRPEREAVGVAAQGLQAELERHATVMLALYDAFRSIAETDDDHDDLELADVVARLKPLLDSLPAEE